MAIIHEDRCAQNDIDPKDVERIAKRIERAAKEAKSLGLTVFGGSGYGDIRLTGQGCQGVVAEISGGSWDGGDGADEY